MCLITRILISLLIAFIASYSWADKDNLPPVVVEVSTAQIKPWQQQVLATGSLVAEPGIILRPEINGRITHLCAKPGDFVKAGTLLLTLNGDIQKAQWQQAMAQEQLSKANYLRSLQLYPQHFLSKADFEQVKETYLSDKANVAKTKAEYEQTRLYAPFTGRVGLNSVNIGDYVSSGQALLNLQAIDPLRIDFSIPEIYLNQLTKGQAVTMQVASYLKQIFQGKVSAIDAQVDTNTRSIAVRATIPNPKHSLTPGSFAQVNLDLGNKQYYPTIPQTALTYSEDGDYVYRIVNKHAVKTAVIAGARNSDEVAIIKGLQNNETVASVGTLKLQDGSLVIIRKGGGNAHH